MKKRLTNKQAKVLSFIIPMSIFIILIITLILCSPVDTIRINNILKAVLVSFLGSLILKKFCYYIFFNGYSREKEEDNTKP